GLSDIDERSLACVLKQPVLADTGDQNVGKAIVVIVPNRNAHAIHLNFKRCFMRYVGERSISIVPLEADGADLLLVAVPIHAIDEENVLPAIAVVIEKGTPRTQGLRKILPPECAAVVPELNTSTCSHIYKSKAWIGNRRSCQSIEQAKTGS